MSYIATFTSHAEKNYIHFLFEIDERSFKIQIQIQ